MSLSAKIERDWASFKKQTLNTIGNGWDSLVRLNDRIGAQSPSYDSSRRNLVKLGLLAPLALSPLTRLIGENTREGHSISLEDIQHILDKRLAASESIAAIVRQKYKTENESAVPTVEVNLENGRLFGRQEQLPQSRVNAPFQGYSTAIYPDDRTNDWKINILPPSAEAPTSITLRGNSATHPYVLYGPNSAVDGNTFVAPLLAWSNGPWRLLQSLGVIESNTSGELEAYYVDKQLAYTDISPVISNGMIISADGYMTFYNIAQGQDIKGPRLLMGTTERQQLFELPNKTNDDQPISGAGPYGNLVYSQTGDTHRVLTPLSYAEIKDGGIMTTFRGLAYTEAKRNAKGILEAKSGFIPPIRYNNQTFIPTQMAQSGELYVMTGNFISGNLVGEPVRPVSKSIVTMEIKGTIPTVKIAASIDQLQGDNGWYFTDTAVVGDKIIANIVNTGDLRGGVVIMNKDGILVDTYFLQQSQYGMCAFKGINKAGNEKMILVTAGYDTDKGGYGINIIDYNAGASLEAEKFKHQRIDFPHAQGLSHPEVTVSRGKEGSFLQVTADAQNIRNRQSWFYDLRLNLNDAYIIEGWSGTSGGSSRTGTSKRM